MSDQYILGISAFYHDSAAALLKIAGGEAPFRVALRGLHKPRDPDTVYSWLDKYLDKGLIGLVHKPRGHRGFSPSGGRGGRPDLAPGP